MQEYSAGGATTEANGQLLHTGHHEAKTAKAWDAELSANRDVTWTTLLGRIYETRAWDYRRYVTVLTDAIDRVASAPPEDLTDVLNREVYLALTVRDLAERLNPGDDHHGDEVERWSGRGQVGLTHRDPETGQRAPGPSQAAAAEATARWATTSPVQPEAGTSECDSDGSGDGNDAAKPAAPAVKDAAADPDGAHGSAQDVRKPRLLRAPHQDRMAGPFKDRDIKPPAGWTRRDWARHIRERYANGDNIAPF